MNDLPEQDHSQWASRFNWHYITLLVIVLLAIFLRMWQLGSLPPGLNHDEAYHGLDALSLLSGETFPVFHEGWELYAQQIYEGRPVYDTRFPVFFEGNFGREAFYIYLISLSIAILGATPTAVRLIPAIFGVLAVVSTYLAARVIIKERKTSSQVDGASSSLLFNEVIPLIAALLVATMYPAITFSRLGERAMLFLPISAFTIYCFWKGVEDSESRQQLTQPSTEDPSLPLGQFAPRWFLLSGILLGFGLYVYAAARFLPLVFLLYVAFWYWRDRSVFRRQWVNLLLMALVAAVVALPMIIFMIRHPFFLILRSKVIANRGEGTFPGRPWLTWLNNLVRIPQGLIWEGDTNLLHNLPGRPFLDPIQLLFVISGIVSIIVNRFRRRELFLMIWLLVMLLPGLLSGDAPHFARLLGIVSPIAILAAIGVSWFGIVISNRLTPFFSRARMFVAGGLILMLILSATLSVYDYFGRYATLPELLEVFDVGDWQLGQYAARLPLESTVYMTPNQEEMATIYFALEGDKERLRSFHSPNQSLLPLGQKNQPVYYIVRPYSHETVNHLVSKEEIEEIDGSNPEFLAFLRPNITVKDGVSDISWSGAITLVDWQVEQTESSLDVILSWQALVEMDHDYTAFVHVLSQDGTLVSQLDRPPDGYPTSDWRPGERVTDKYRIQLPEDTPSGTYIIQSGFYYLPTQERLGEPIVLGEVEIQ